MFIFSIFFFYFLNTLNESAKGYICVCIYMYMNPKCLCFTRKKSSPAEKYKQIFNTALQEFLLYVDVKGRDERVKLWWPISHLDIVCSSTQAPCSYIAGILKYAGAKSISICHGITSWYFLSHEFFTCSKCNFLFRQYCEICKLITFRKLPLTLILRNGFSVFSNAVILTTVLYFYGIRHLCSRGYVDSWQSQDIQQ